MKVRLLWSVKPMNNCHPEEMAFELNLTYIGIEYRLNQRFWCWLKCFSFSHGGYGVGETKKFFESILPKNSKIEDSVNDIKMKSVMTTNNRKMRC